MVFQEDRVADVRARAFHLGADLLSSDERVAGHVQPDVAHHAAIVPPVVPKVPGRDKLHGPPGNGLGGWLVVDLHSENIEGFQMRCDIEKVLGVSALMPTDFAAIQPHPRLVERRAEMDLHMFGTQLLGDFKRAEIPGRAFEVVVFANVPGMRDAHRIRALRELPHPASRFTLFPRVCAELPVTVEIHMQGSEDPGRPEHAQANA